MAYGIEEIAKMQVTGPVQGGDMIMKPDQAPVGAAALLNKMQNKNTPGIFKLPMPDKEMPNFMKVAAEGVEQQTAKGDTINQMAGALLRQGVNIQGMGMDEIIQIYEQTFGSPGDVDEFGVSKVAPSDWRTILKMIQSGMSEEEIEAQMAAAKFPGNFTQENQNVVELPRNLKTAPDNPETELAYITNDEKALLALMNPGTPHEGPEGVPTYDEGDYLDYKPSGMAGTGYQGPTGEQRQAGRRGEGPGTGAIQETMLEAALAGDTGQTYGAAAAEAGYDWAQPAAEEIVSVTDTSGAGNVINEAVKSLDTSQQALYNLINAGKKTDAKRLMDSGVTLPTSFISVPGVITGVGLGIIQDLMTDDTKTDDDKTEEDKDLEWLIKTAGKGIIAPGSLVAGEIGKMLGDFKVTPEKLQDQNYLAIMKDKLKGDDLKEFLKDHSGVIADAYGPEEVGGADAFQAALRGAKAPEGSEAQKRTKPWEYYDQERYEEARDATGKYKDKFFKPLSSRFAATSGNLEDIASIDVNMPGMTKKFKQKIFDARNELDRQKNGQEKRSGGGGGGGAPIEEQIAETITETATTNPLAGAFNVGGTMPYTHDVATAGVETNVPLGRRFGIDKAGKYDPTGRDLSKAMEYATLGGYSQLEPFQEYLARRRKYLDEDKPQYFDEDGNVIYSGVT